MGISTIQLNPFNAVVNGQIANVDLNNLLGFAVKQIWVQLGGGLTPAMVTSVQLKVNGKVIIDSSATRLNLVHAYRGNNVTPANFFVIDFTEQAMFTKLGFLGGALDTTLGIKSLRLEMTIAGAGAGITMSGFANVGLAQLRPEFAGLRPLISRVHSMQQSIGAAGTFPIQIPHMTPIEGGSLFKRVCVFANNATGYRVVRNGVVEYELLTAQNSALQTFYKRTPQTGLLVVDAVLEGLQEDCWDTRPASGASTAQFNVSFSAAETITTEVQVLEPLDVY